MHAAPIVPISMPSGLHNQIEWLYRNVCAELDMPVSSVFINDVLSKQFNF